MKHKCLSALSRLAITIVIAIGLVGCSDSEIEFTNAQINNGKIFQRGANKPFSGIVNNMPESTIPMTGSFNDMLALFNQTMTSAKAVEHTFIGRSFTCTAGVKDGYIEGEVICAQPSSSIRRYTALYKGGRLNGDLSIYSHDGNKLLLKTAFQDNHRDGKTEIYSPRSGKLLVDYNSILGNVDGVQTMYADSTGNITYSATAEKGKYVGTVKTFNDQGKPISEMPYVNGLLNGVYKEWDPITGNQLKSITYVDGDKEGAMKLWYEDGSVIQEGVYSKGNFSPAKLTGAPAQDTATSNDCFTLWVNAFHKNNGEDAMITDEQSTEFDSWCAQGKNP